MPSIDAPLSTVACFQGPHPSQVFWVGNSLADRRTLTATRSKQWPTIARKKACKVDLASGADKLRDSLALGMGQTFTAFHADSAE
jgi:hypothetical protein